MNKMWKQLGLIILFLLPLVVACGNVETTVILETTAVPIPEIAALPTNTPLPPTETAVPPTNTPEPTATQTPQPTDTPEPSPTPLPTAVPAEIEGQTWLVYLDQGCDNSFETTYFFYFDPNGQFKWIQSGPYDMSALPYGGTWERDGDQLTIVLGQNGFTAEFDIVGSELIDNAGVENRCRLGHWLMPGQNYPEGRTYHQAVQLDNGLIVIVGGFQPHFAGEEKRISDLVSIYDPVSGSWQNVGTLDIPRVWQRVVALPDNRVLVFGGYDGAENVGTIVEINVKSADEAAITVVGEVPFGFDNESATAILLPDGRVLISGGYLRRTNTQQKGSIFYNPADHSIVPAASMNVLRSNHVAVLLDDGRVLVIGGNSESATAEIYDPAADIWTLTGEMAAAHAFPTVVKLGDGRVFVTGGIAHDTNTGASLTDVTVTEIFDPATNEWQLSAVALSDKIIHDAHLLLDGRVLVLNGYDRTGAEFALNTFVEVYDPTTDSWTNLHPMPVAAHHHTAHVLADGTILVIGGGYDSAPLPIVQRYDPVTNTWTLVP